MYRFIDVTDMQESEFLPSEALKINGEYIEDLIPCYQTLSVSGREALSPHLETYETGTRDGASIHYKRYPSRLITVKYLIKAASTEEFREAYNKLGEILDVKDAQLIFADELDKFFIGTPSRIREVDSGSNKVVGEFEITCTDPFKYSVDEYEAEADVAGSSIVIDYSGTYKAFPTLEASFYDENDAGTMTGNGDCGYVAFFTEDEKVVQLGDPDEIDGSNAYEKSQTLINHPFKTSSAWDSKAQGLWALNKGNSVSQVLNELGTVGMGVADYTTPAAPKGTHAKLLYVRTSTGSPLLYYGLNGYTSKRTANSVYVSISIGASLETSASGIGTDRELVASVYIGGAWRNVTIKKKTDHWQKGKVYTKTLALTVSGLSASQTALTGIKFKVARTDSLGQAGILAETACSNLPVSAYVAPEPSVYYLKATSFGSVEGWHGPTITRQITADAAGEVGAANFTFYFKHKMSGATNSLGAFQAMLADASGNVVAGVRIYKNKFGSSATMVYYVNGTRVHETTVDISTAKTAFKDSTANTPCSSIHKAGGTFIFNVAGLRNVFENADLAATKVTAITFMFEQYSDYAALEHNGLYLAKFVKNNCDTWKNIPNKFSASDVVQANCKNGEILLNGTPTPELGALGNDWEGFVLKPGVNQIGFAYSNWVTSDYAPTIKVKYREVFL